MDLVGYVTILGMRYPIAYTSFNKTSRMWLLMDNEKNYVPYSQGEKIQADDVVEMLDIGQQCRIGSAIMLEKILEEITNFKIKCIMEQTFTVVNGVVQYQDQNGNRLHLVGQDYVFIDFKSKKGFEIYIERTHTFSIDKPGIRKRMEKIELDQTKASISSFKDSTIESLELRGYNFDWMKEKDYISIHTARDLDDIFLRDFKNALVKSKQAGEKLLVTIDFESTGLNAYDEKCPHRDVATFMGISFEDHKAYGFFLDMVHFENIPKESAAKLFTHLFSHDLSVDRDIDILGTVFKRSDYVVSGQNIMIDVRFGLTIGIDIWFNLCALQLGFNLDPFLTRGHNSAEDRVKQFFDIDYPGLGETAGKDFYGYFNKFSDKRVILMYGCADVDLVRLYIKIMLEKIPELEPYFGVDQVSQFHRLDEVYLNMKARFDYKGIRIDKTLALQRAKTVESNIKTLHNFLALYVPRASLTNSYMEALYDAEKTGRDKKTVPIPNLDKVDMLQVDKWSGDFLSAVLFKHLGYPVLYWLSNDDPSKVKPKLDKEAISDYQTHKANTVYPSKIESVEDFNIYGKYIKNDIFYDDGSIAISAEIFNSLQYPIFYILSLLGPLTKELSADFTPIIADDSDYRFCDTRTTTIVTRRDVSPLSTVKGSNKDLYIPYTDDYYILGADQDAVEIRIAFGLSKDPTIINPLKHPENDPHLETAAQMYRKPTFLVSKQERTLTKFINFGRIYKRGAYSICKQIFGVVTPELKALTERMLALFDQDKEHVHKVLDQYRKRAIQVVDVPEWLRWFLKMDENKDYGKMDNKFGFVQHVDLSREEPWYIPMMERKAGNFAVQGTASNLLRLVYTRFIQSCWEKGWIQDESVIVHTTIYDEILLSYHKNINPMELLNCLYKSFVVLYDSFPPLYIGVNIAKSWGDTKRDKFEIPSLLLKRFSDSYENNDEYEIDFKEIDHVQFFLDNIVEYKYERIRNEIYKKGFTVDKVLHMEEFSARFTSYYVRSLLLQTNEFLFKIIDENDPVETLASTLLFHISKYILKSDESVKLVLRGKSVNLSSESHMIFYDSETDFLNGVGSVVESDIHDLDNTLSLLDEDDDEDDTVYTFNDTEEDYYLEGNMSVRQWILPELYDPTSVKVQPIKEVPKFNNFVVRANYAVLPVETHEQLIGIKKFLQGKISTSTNAVKLFGKYRSKSYPLGDYKTDVLTDLDRKEDLWILTK